MDGQPNVDPDGRINKIQIAFHTEPEPNDKHRPDNDPDFEATRAEYLLCKLHQEKFTEERDSPNTIPVTFIPAAGLMGTPAAGTFDTNDKEVLSDLTIFRNVTHGVLEFDDDRVLTLTCYNLSKRQGSGVSPCCLGTPATGTFPAYEQIYERRSHKKGTDYDDLLWMCGFHRNEVKGFADRLDADKRDVLALELEKHPYSKVKISQLIEAVLPS
ncbi:hypothetical protein B0T17DRAFT_618243 [Bombardia bombarda]|uniref:Uncharacterized protein n=1 Tax=Bombardia bombarda TaxID=252184 RepID=A0AA39WUL3_9PEZI|nr:hypothetical protein B0T17DRAFT_618243 [Bombardia bombarda]